MAKLFFGHMPISLRRLAKYTLPSVLALLLVFGPGFEPTQALAGIVDVSGISVPEPNGPVCAYCNGAGCDQCQPQSPDPAPDPEPSPSPTPTPQPTPTPVSTPTPTPTPIPTPVPAPPPPVGPSPEELRQQQFEREKQALMDAFRIPQGLADASANNIPAESDAIVLNEDTVFGMGPAPVGLGQPGGLTSEEWKQAGECQKQMDALNGKWPLSGEEIALLEQVEAQRNALWKKAISIPGLTAEERERLRLEFHVRGQRAGEPAPSTVTPEAIQQWQKVPPPPPYKEPATSAPVPEPVNPVTTMLLKHFLIDQPTAGAEYIGEKVIDTAIGDSPFGNVVGLGKIAIAYKEGGLTKARAATADFLVGLISYPQAQFAVEGGRVYSNVVYESLNRFMTDAMKSTGGNFDKEKFWLDLKNKSSSDIQALMEWIKIGTD